MEENTVTEELTREQRYEKTREFVQDWANKNMNYFKLLGNEDRRLPRTWRILHLFIIFSRRHSIRLF